MKQHEILFDLHTGKKSESNQHILKDDFRQLQNRSKNYQQFYTDGSKEDSKVGCAVTSDNHSNMQRIHVSLQFENWKFARSNSRQDSFRHANNKCADKSAWMRRLFCTLVVRKPPLTGFLASMPIILLRVPLYKPYHEIRSVLHYRKNKSSDC